MKLFNLIPAVLVGCAALLPCVSASSHEVIVKTKVSGPANAKTEAAKEAVVQAELEYLGVDPATRKLAEQASRKLGGYNVDVTKFIENKIDIECKDHPTTAPYHPEFQYCVIFDVVLFLDIDYDGSLGEDNFTGDFEDLSAGLKAATEGALQYWKEVTPNGVAGEEVIILFGYGVKGDPHFKSFSGEWFDYHGECDLVLMEIPNFYNHETLTVHARTTIRYHYSYVSSIAARLGDDVFEVSSFGDYALNGIESADLDDAYFGGYPLEHTVPDQKTHLFKLQLTDDETIVFKTFRDLVSIEVEDIVSKKIGRGILGDLETGKLLGRDGKTVFTDMNAFGQEWQVRDTEPMLFRVARAPQYPEEKCRLPKVSASDKRRLGEGMAREKAEIACGRFTGVEFDNCVFDVMAVGDIDIAKAGAF